MSYPVKAFFKRLRIFFIEYAEVFFVFGFMLFVILFVVYKKNSTNKEGVITVAKITRYEAAESGGSLYADVYLDGKIFEILVNETCSDFKIGKYYFAKVKREDPNDYAIVYCRREVPACILDSIKYYRGWSDFPVCK